MRQIAYALTAVCLALGALPPTGAMDIDASALKRAMHSAQKAQTALRAGNLNKAQHFFDLALQAVPQLPEAHLGLGQVFMQRRSFEEALAEFERARNNYGLMGDALLSIQWDRHDEAQTMAERLRNEATRLRQLGEKTFGSARSRAFSAATRAEQKAQRLEGVRPPTARQDVLAPGEVYFHIGNALLNLGRLGDAIEAWEMSAKREPAFPLVHHNLAVGYWKLNRLDTALQSMRRAEALGFEVNPQFKSDLERGLQAIRPSISAD